MPGTGRTTGRSAPSVRGVRCRKRRPERSSNQGAASAAKRAFATANCAPRGGRSAGRVRLRAGRYGRPGGRERRAQRRRGGWRRAGRAKATISGRCGSRGGSGRVRAAGGMGIARSALGARRAGAMGEESAEGTNSCMEPRPIGPSRVPSRLVRRGQAVACPRGLPVSRDCASGPKRTPPPVARRDGRRPRTGATRA